ncbi:glutathione-dependent formaldehyde-activating, GFA, partial [Lophium mytilinum]
MPTTPPPAPPPLPLAGTCACTTIRFHLTAAPLFTHCCHCTRCQRETGTAFALNAVIESTHVVLLSPTAPAGVLVPSDGGHGQTIFRCPACYTPVWSVYGAGSDKISYVRVGTLEAEVRPDIHIYTRSKKAWVGLEGGVPAVEEFYDKEGFWPEESLERLRRV